MEGKFGRGVLAALVGVAVGLGVQSVSATLLSAPTRTFTVVIKEREAQVVDLGPAGPSHGDLLVINTPLYNAQGTQVIGRADSVCTLTDPADTPRAPGHIMQCLTTHSVPGGQLTTQTLRIYPGLTERSVRVRGAITGGSGAYQTARGGGE